MGEYEATDQYNGFEVVDDDQSAWWTLTATAPLDILTHPRWWLVSTIVRLLPQQLLSPGVDQLVPQPSVDEEELGVRGHRNQGQGVVGAP